MDSKKDEQKVERFSSGDTYPVGDCGKFEAGINHLTPHANEMEFDGKLVRVGKDEAVWFQRIAALGNTPEQAEALRDEVLAALQQAEAMAATPGDNSIDNARAWLGGAFGREYKAYIEAELAGDFACALVRLFERKDQEIERLKDHHRKHAARLITERGQLREALADQSSVVVQELIRRAADVVEGLHGEDLPGAMPVRIQKLKTALARLNSSSVSANQCGDCGFPFSTGPHCMSHSRNAVSAGGADERPAFEAFAKSTPYGSQLHYVRDALPKDDIRYGEYVSEALRLSWEAWQARAALTASAPNHSEQVRHMVREGWQLVPVEPSVQMERAGTIKAPGFITLRDACDIYKAMLAAAPSAGSQGGDV